MRLNDKTKAELVREIADLDRHITLGDRYLTDQKNLVEAADDGGDDASSAFVSSLNDLCDAIVKAKSEATKFGASDADQSSLAAVVSMLPTLEAIGLRFAHASMASDDDDGDDGTIAVTEADRPKRINLREINFNEHRVPRLDGRGRKFTQPDTACRIDLKQVDFEEHR